MTAHGTPKSRLLEIRSALRFWLALVLFLVLAGFVLMIAGLSTDRHQFGWPGDPAAPMWANAEVATLARFAAGLALAELILLTFAAVEASRAAARHRRDVQARRDSEQFTRATLDALPAQIAIIDEAGVVLAVNRSWRQFSDGLAAGTVAAGGRAEHLVERTPEGGNFLAMCDAATGRRHGEAAAIAAAARRVLAGKADLETLETAGAAPGEWYLCRVSRFASPPAAADRSEPARAVVLFEDIGQRKAAEEAVRRAKEAADAANAAKSAFLANMSHEIRTPMTAILGYAELLQDAARTPAERDRCLRIVRRNGEHLLAIINDILDLSKIEADKLELERVPVRLRQVVSDVATLVRQRAADRAVAFEVVFDGPVPERVHTDALRLRQVLINLLGNAVKFTPAGGRVALRVACEPTVASSILQFDVIDNGVGMGADQVAMLFKPFSQGDQSTTRRYGGTGLGLSISRRLAQLLGGDIVVNSSPGAGTTFSCWVDGGPLQGVRMLDDGSAGEFDLPDADARPPAGAAASAGAAAAHEDLTLRGRVLLAEDGEDNRELLCAILGNAGLAIDCVGDGRRAVQAALADPRIDLVILDMQMPEMDGYAAARALRAAGYAKPIVALTANAMTGDRRRCLDAGCDEYCSKPVDRQRLLSTLARLLSRAPRPPAAAAPDASVGARIAQTPTGLRSDREGNATMGRLLLKFVERLPERAAEIESLLRDQNFAELSRAVHQIKGAAGGYGFPTISESAGRVEARLRQESALGEVQEAVQGLLRLIRSVEGYGPPPLLTAPAAATAAPVKAAATPALPAPERPGPTGEEQRSIRTDPTTGLPDRACFTGCFAAEISRARRAGAAVWLLVLRAEGLAARGAAAAEDVAGEVARRLRAARGDALLGRWGVDQFVVALRAADRPAAAAVAEALLGACCPPVEGVRWSAEVCGIDRAVASARDALRAALERSPARDVTS